MSLAFLPHIAAALGIHASAQRIHETDDLRGDHYIVEAALDK
jgi:hypothetical protein